jgi:ribose/xylose/arabinose/galactoside ABC-type transport system permease subunit
MMQIKKRQMRGFMTYNKWHDSLAGAIILAIMAFAIAAVFVTEGLDIMRGMI